MRVAVNLNLRLRLLTNLAIVHRIVTQLVCNQLLGHVLEDNGVQFVILQIPIASHNHHEVREGRQQIHLHADLESGTPQATCTRFNEDRLHRDPP